MKLKLIICLTVLSTFLMLNINASSATANIKARLPEIVKLKQLGIVGENNQGYLDFRKSDPGKQSLIKQENNDSATIYKNIAIKVNSTVKKVGQLRAKEIAGKASKGYWIQALGGQWYKK